MDERDNKLGMEDESAPRRAPRRGPGVTARDSMQDSVAAGERESFERGIFAEDRDLTEQERLELFRDSLSQSVLPDLPPMPGYHVFWATTSNPRDSIAYRLRLGYELIRLEMCPGWEGVGVSAGGMDGVVGVNEMVAMRLPDRLYRMYMREVHHTLPLAEEEKLRAVVDDLKENAARRGSRVDAGDGTEQLVQRARAPEFAP